ncbi:MAG: chorismate mutase [Rhodobiaceae bacterium]|nr:chorismate mutase [Rhodobiaceae bacterium]MCC0056820.1 chorismate mutase [Rhodobiaceae bacterium]
MGDQPELSRLRDQLDRIDGEMHSLLMERGTVIAAIREAKRSAETGSAFRPGREAEMMRAIAARHDGVLPLATVEHIWREIIGTFTQMQAAFSIHVAEGSRIAMRDMARFYFGFATPLVDHDDVGGALAALANNLDDLALLPLSSGRGWWRDLDPRLAIIARIPFFGFPQSVSPEPMLVVGDARIDLPQGPLLYSVDAVCEALPAEIGEIVARGTSGGIATLLVASDLNENALARRFAEAGIEAGHLRLVGAYAKAAAFDARSGG